MGLGISFVHSLLKWVWRSLFSEGLLQSPNLGPSGHKLLGKGAHGIEVRASWTPNAAEASMVAPQASFVPLPRPTVNSAPRGRRSHQRWADGLESVDAGRRDFFPAGWVPSKAVAESIQTLGYSPPQGSKFGLPLHIIIINRCQGRGLRFCVLGCSAAP